MKKLLIAAALVIAAITVAPVYADMDSDLADQINELNAVMGVATGHAEAVNDPAYQRFEKKSKQWQEIERQCRGWAKRNYKYRDVENATKYCMDENGVPR